MSEHVEVLVEAEGGGDYGVSIEFPLRGLRGNVIYASVYGFGHAGDDESEERFVALAKEIANLFKSASIKIKRPVFEYFNTQGEKIREEG